MKTYLAFTLGPIYKTLLKARKTRELWISSYLFSYLMRLLLTEVETKRVGRILLPDISYINDYESFHGAGFFNDRCIIELHDGKSFNNDDYKSLRNNIIHELSKIFTGDQKQIEKDLTEYLQIYGVLKSLDLDELEKEEDEKKRSVVFILNKMMDDMERQTVYQPTASDVVDTLFDNVTEFYSLGFDPGELRSFKKVIRNGNKSIDILSFPSVVEIATKQLRIKQPKYDNVVDELLTEGIPLLISEKKDELIDTNDTKIIEKLRKSFSTDFKTAHKYICVVNADGDSMGKCSGEIGNDWDKLDLFSKNLSAFARKSADIIHEYGGHPVYIGGDDLFFLAPVISTVNETDQSIFDLIKRLDLCFRGIWDNNKIKDVDVQTSMSYGISITYYKYPLAEAISLSHELLGDAKKVPGKNAIATQVMHHSGQYSKTVFEKRAGGSFEEFLALLKDFPTKDTFISSVHDRIRSDRTLIETIGIDDPIDFSGYFNNEYDIANIRDHVKKNFIENSIKIFESMFETQTKIWLGKEPDEEKRKAKIKEEAMSQLDTIYRLLNFLIRTDND